MGIKNCDLLTCSGSAAAEGLQKQDGLIPEVLGWACLVCFGFFFLVGGHLKNTHKGAKCDLQ